MSAKANNHPKPVSSKQVSQVPLPFFPISLGNEANSPSILLVGISTNCLERIATYKRDDCQIK